MIKDGADYMTPMELEFMSFAFAGKCDGDVSLGPCSAMFASAVQAMVNGDHKELEMLCDVHNAGHGMAAVVCKEIGDNAAHHGVQASVSGSRDVGIL